MEYTKQFAASVKERRNELKLTQREVADRCGMHQQTYQLIESGKNSDVRISTLYKIATALECKPSDLII